MSKTKKRRSWKELMRQRERIRDGVGGEREALNQAFGLLEDDHDDDSELEDIEEFEHLWRENNRDLGMN